MKSTSTKKVKDGWEGIIKEDNIIIWSCGHSHRTRDFSGTKKADNKNPNKNSKYGHEKSAKAGAEELNKLSADKFNELKALYEKQKNNKEISNERKN